MSTTYTQSIDCPVETITIKSENNKIILIIKFRNSSQSISKEFDSIELAQQFWINLIKNNEMFAKCTVPFLTEDGDTNVNTNENTNENTNAIQSQKSSSNGFFSSSFYVVRLLILIIIVALTLYFFYTYAICKTDNVKYLKIIALALVIGVIYSASEQFFL